MRIPVLCVLALLWFAQSALSQNTEPADTTSSVSGDVVKRDRFVEKVTVKEVQRFLDPTRMINRIEYSFLTSYLPSDAKLFTHTLRPWIAVNNRHAITIRVPYSHFSIPDADGPSGFGDVSAGWGFILREKLNSRLTTLAGNIGLLLPTGDFDKGTGFDTWGLSPALLLASNPTDLFPVNIIVRYKHSLGSKGGSESAGLRVRLMEITLQTFHILPRGFYLAFLPSYVWDLEQGFDVFSLGFGIGRALNRQLAFDIGYIQHISGKETFNRGVQFGLKILWGRDHGQP